MQQVLLSRVLQAAQDQRVVVEVWEAPPESRNMEVQADPIEPGETYVLFTEAWSDREHLDLPDQLALLYPDGRLVVHDAQGEKRELFAYTVCPLQADQV